MTMRLTEMVHARLAEHLQAGDLAIDATAGNGHDTAFLAAKVGAGGRVIAIDIQADALAATRARLEAAGLADRVELIQSDHAAHLNTLRSSHAGSAAAILFNLGYLPGGDKSIVTHAGGTAIALEAAHELLRPGGLLSVTAYRGHPGGPEEASVVETWMQERVQQGAPVEQHSPTASNHPPILWLLKKAEH